MDINQQHLFYLLMTYLSWPIYSCRSRQKFLITAIIIWIWALLSPWWQLRSHTLLWTWGMGEAWCSATVACTPHGTYSPQIPPDQGNVGNRKCTGCVTVAGPQRWKEYWIILLKCYYFSDIFFLLLQWLQFYWSWSSLHVLYILLNGIHQDLFHAPKMSPQNVLSRLSLLAQSLQVFWGDIQPKVLE